MKSYREELTFQLPARMDFVNITPQVEVAVQKSGIREGLCLVNAMHITASVFINDDEPGLIADYKRWLEELAPFDPSPQRYQHNRTGEDNADAHHKRHDPLRGCPGVARLSSPSLAANWTLARGSRFSTASSMATARSGCW